MLAVGPAVLAAEGAALAAAVAGAVAGAEAGAALAVGAGLSASPEGFEHAAARRPSASSAAAPALAWRRGAEAAGMLFCLCGGADRVNVKRWLVSGSGRGPRRESAPADPGAAVPERGREDLPAGAWHTRC
jgi:hypothetical protein